MEVKHRISAAQFFITMFVSRAAVTVTFNAGSAGGRSFTDSAAASLPAAFITAVLAIPLLILRGRYPSDNVCGIAGSKYKFISKALSIVYLIYFVFVNASALALFQIFFHNTVNPDFSPFLVLATIALVGAYGAFRGIEAVSRCGICVFVILLLGSALTFFIASGRFMKENLEPLFYNGYDTLTKSTELFISHASVLADMAILLPMVNGKISSGFASWNLGTALYTGATLLVLTGSLGRYAYTQSFPIYTLSAVTQVNSMQRLDAVFIGIWLMGVTVKLAGDLYACRVCLGRISSGKFKKAGLCIVSAAVPLIALSGVYFKEAREFLLNTRIMFIMTVTAGAVIPLSVLICGLIFGRRKKPGASGKKPAGDAL